MSLALNGMLTPIQRAAASSELRTPETADITVRAGTDVDNAVLEVADEGPGMEGQDAHRVFERFYRTDTSRARASGGTAPGEGLPIQGEAAADTDVAAQLS